MSKKCSRCGKVKVIAEFGVLKCRPDGRNTICKECKRLYENRWYSGRKVPRRKQIRNHDLARIEDNQRRLFEYLLEHPCVDCGESDPVVLEFDHRDNKTGEIGSMQRTAYSWDRIEREIKKCDVRCANCHRRKTAKEQGWGRFRLASKA